MPLKACAYRKKGMMNLPHPRITTSFGSSVTHDTRKQQCKELFQGYTSE